MTGCTMMRRVAEKSVQEGRVSHSVLVRVEFRRRCRPVPVLQHDVRMLGIPADSDEQRHRQHKLFDHQCLERRSVCGARLDSCRQLARLRLRHLGVLEPQHAEHAVGAAQSRTQEVDANTLREAGREAKTWATEGTALLPWRSTMFAALGRGIDAPCTRSQAWRGQRRLARKAQRQTDRASAADCSESKEACISPELDWSSRITCWIPRKDPPSSSVHDVKSSKRTQRCRRLLLGTALLIGAKRAVH